MIKDFKELFDLLTNSGYKMYIRYYSLVFKIRTKEKIYIDLLYKDYFNHNLTSSSIPLLYEYNEFFYEDITHYKMMEQFDIMLYSLLRDKDFKNHCKNIIKSQNKISSISRGYGYLPSDEDGIESKKYILDLVFVKNND